MSLVECLTPAGRFPVFSFLLLLLLFLNVGQRAASHSLIQVSATASPGLVLVLVLLVLWPRLASTHDFSKVAWFESRARSPNHSPTVLQLVVLLDQAGKNAFAFL